MTRKKSTEANDVREKCQGGHSNLYVGIWKSGGPCKRVDEIKRKMRLKENDQVRALSHDHTRPTRAGVTAEGTSKGSSAISSFWAFETG
jgi:hypothetical protein